MFAAVALDSSSLRLEIGIQDGNRIHVVKAAQEPARLGAGLDDSGKLTASTMQAALHALHGFRASLDERNPDAVRAVASRTLLVARNAEGFLRAAEEAIGQPIEIISPEEEARLIYLGVSNALGSAHERRLLIDVRGGSTDVVIGCGPDIRHVESFSIGTVKQRLSFFSSGRIEAESLDAAILSARAHFEDASALYTPGAWNHAYGTSETLCTISEVICKNAIGDGTTSLDSLNALKALLVEARHTRQFCLPGVSPERLPAMLGGLTILIAALEEMGARSIVAVNAGLLSGILCDLQLRASNRDRRENSIREFARRFHADPSRGKRVADIASDLYARLKPETDMHARYLHWSGIVHEAGLAVSQTGYHKHAVYLVEHADMSGFTSQEQHLLARLLLGQKGNLRKIGNALTDPDFAKAILALRLAVTFMHARSDADTGGISLRMTHRIELEATAEWFARHPTVSYWAQKERDYWNEIGVEFLVKTI